MKRKILLFLMIAMLLFTMFVGCDNHNSDNEPSTNESIQGTTESATKSAINIDELTYSQYNAMSSEQQQEVVNMFDTVEEFIHWYNEEKQFHEEFQDKIYSNITIEPTDATNDSEPNKTTETIDGTEGTDPVESKPETSGVTYLEYHAMSGKEQKKFINSFPSIDAFMEWHTAAYQAYKDSLTEIDGTTPIDLGELNNNGN